MPDLKLLFLQMAVILATARLVAGLLRLLGQPEVVGEMVAGILLGPTLLGKIAPATMNGLFPADGLGPLYALSQFGLVIFMFLVGLDVRPGEVRRAAKSIALISAASMAAPFFCGAILAWNVFERVGAGPSRFTFTLFIGAAMSITAFPVLARILADRKMTRTRPGELALSCAAVNDVAAWCALAVITVIAQPNAHHAPLTMRFAGLGLFILAMLFAIRPALRRLAPAHASLNPQWLSGAMIFLLVSVCATEVLGVHALFGAFLAGIAMPRAGKLETEFRNGLESVTMTLLVPLFFAFSGLRTNATLLTGWGDWLLCGLIVLIAVASKFLATAVCVHLAGSKWRESLAVGVLVNTRGLVELVILNAGLDLHILSARMFSMMTIMAVATTVMTGPVLDCMGLSLSRSTGTAAGAA